MPSPAASSARGGRSSAPYTELPDRSAERRSAGIRLTPAGVWLGAGRSYYTMRAVTPAALREALARVPSLPLAPHPTPVEPLPRLAAMIGGGPRLYVKRDDAIAFGFGGN